MELNMKKIGKIAGAACVATGVVAVSALVASGAAVGAIVEGFKSASSAMKNSLIEQKQDENTVVEQSPVVPAAESVEENQ